MMYTSKVHWHEELTELYGFQFNFTGNQYERYYLYICMVKRLNEWKGLKIYVVEPMNKLETLIRTERRGKKVFGMKWRFWIGTIRQKRDYKSLK